MPSSATVKWKFYVVTIIRMVPNNVEVLEDHTSVLTFMFSLYFVAVFAGMVH